MRFHNIVQPIMFKDDVQVVPPENIYNVNESGYTVCNKPQKVDNAINKQATNGQKDDQLRYLQNMCRFCARTVANLMHVNSPGGSTPAR